MASTWASGPIHITPTVCVDVHVDGGTVVLGQIHGEHDEYAADLKLTPIQARDIAAALDAGADRAGRR